MARSRLRNGNGEPGAREGFGAFGGVFTPCTLTILGVIMFLRFGQVVGNAGLWQAILIVLVSKAITTLTALSLSAVATNTRVEGGGAYFLISRSLGPEFGASIGLVFYLAQAVSVAMYVLGFTEALMTAFAIPLGESAVATVVNLGVFVCVYVGAGWAIKFQYVILGLLAASLVSFFAGAVGAFDPALLESNAAPNFEGGASFFTMFALFFPAATGIMAGANLSGDLKNPGKAIPVGTLSAIAVTGVVYVAIAVALAGTSSHGALVGNSMIMEEVATVGVLITLGVFAATISSGVGSMLGAPRILQSLARDGMFKRLRFFGAGDGPNNEPRRATVLTFLIAQVCIVLGDLNAIAPIITMFFLITYGVLNLATFYESITKNPSYRPTFKWSHWSSALLGALGCAAVMFLTSPIWALGSIVVMAGIFWYVSRRQVIATWGDAQSGAAFARARKSLLRLEDEQHYHPKNWRPSIIAFSGGAWTRVHLGVFGYWLTARRGVLTLAQVITGEVSDHLRRRRNQENALRSFIADQGLEAFPAVLVAPSRELGIEALVQCYGIGRMRPNVVLFGWSRDPARLEDFGALLRTASELGRSVAVIREGDPDRDPWLVPPGPIDVWWRGKANGHLMVLLAHLLTQNEEWRDRKLRVLRVVSNEAGVEESTAHLERLITSARVEATARVLVSDNPVEAIHSASRNSALVFLGFIPPETGREAAFVNAQQALMKGLPTVVSVWSAGEVSLDA